MKNFLGTPSKRDFRAILVTTSIIKLSQELPKDFLEEFPENRFKKFPEDFFIKLKENFSKNLRGEILG